MRKIKEVLRLRFELQLGQREIARACSISQGAVHNYLKKAAAAGIGDDASGRCAEEARLRPRALFALLGRDLTGDAVPLK